MSKNTIGQFDFAVTSLDGKSKIQFDPWVVIELKRSGKTANGIPVISPHLMSDAEIDEHVAALGPDLDAVEPGPNVRYLWREMKH